MQESSTQPTKAILGHIKLIYIFKITGRGYIIAGDFFQGVVSKGNYIEIKYNNSLHYFKILQIDFGRKDASSPNGFIGFQIPPEDGEKIKDWDIIGMEVNIVL